MNTLTEVLLTRQQMRFRARKGNREPGFEPIHNAKISGMFQSFYATMIALGKSPMDAHNEALNELRRRLPALPLGTKSGRVKLSKSDDPAYRNNPNFTKEARRFMALDLAKAA